MTTMLMILLLLLHPLSGHNEVCGLASFGIGTRSISVLQLRLGMVSLNVAITDSPTRTTGSVEEGKCDSNNHQEL